MKYVNAKEILPEEIIKKIQQYTDCECLYVPRKGKKKSWGENSGTKKLLSKRNQNIYFEHQNGSNVDEIAKKYFLSVQSIRRIIRQFKK